MLRYRVAMDEDGQFLVLPAWDGIVPIDQTYETRDDARQAIQRLKRLNQEEIHGIGPTGPVMDRCGQC